MLKRVFQLIFLHLHNKSIIPKNAINLLRSIFKNYVFEIMFILIWFFFRNSIALSFPKNKNPL